MVDYAARGLSQKDVWKEVDTRAGDKYLTELVSAYVDSGIPLVRIIIRHKNSRPDLVS